MIKDKTDIQHTVS